MLNSSSDSTPEVSKHNNDKETQFDPSKNLRFICYDMKSLVSPPPSWMSLPLAAFLDRSTAFYYASGIVIINAGRM